MNPRCDYDDVYLTAGECCKDDRPYCDAYGSEDEEEDYSAVVTYSNTALIDGTENELIEVEFNADNVEMEFTIRQDDNFIMMSIDEAEALLEVLVRFLVSTPE